MYEQIVPYLDAAVEAFGTDRLMFNSDWPVCLVSGEYAAILGQNATRFYKLA